ncbi:MAG: MFS transporter [Angelakisella sp.]
MNVRMKWGRAILVSLPFFAVTMFWQAYDYIIPLMLSKHYHLGITAYSMIMSIDNLVALIFLPLFGALSDKIHGKMGRRSPLILWGTIGGLIGMVVMNYADSKAVAGGDTFVLFIVSLCVSVFFMSLYRSPSAALCADCFIRPQRTKANSVLNFLGALAGVIFSIIGKRMISVVDGTPIFTKCIYFVILAMIVSTAFYFLFMRENRFVDDVRQQNIALKLIDEKTDSTDKTPTKLTSGEKKSLFFILLVVFMIYIGYNGYGTHYTNYLVSYLGQPASWTTPYLLRVLLTMIFMVPAAMVASKIGRKKSAIIGSAIYFVGLLGCFTVTPEKSSMLYIWFIIMSVGFPMVSINLGPMVIEIGKDSDSGRYMGYYYIATTIAQIISPTLASVFINMAGYKAISMYAAIAVLLGFVFCFFIKHGDAKPIMKNAVAAVISESD